MKRRNQLIAIILAAAMVLGLTGCRYSDTIEQIIYNQFLSGLIDYEPPFDVKDNEEENEEEDEEIPELEEDDDADREQEEQKAGILSDYATSGEGYDVVYSEDAESGAEVDVEVEGDGDASEDLTESDDTDEEEDNTGTEADALSDEEDTDAPDDTGDESSNGSEGGSGGEESEETGEVETTKETTYKKIVDSSGKKVSVPEGVSSTATIGEAAIMISILRAGESVVATDAVTLNLAKNGAGSSVISDLSGASSLWTGDGSDGITSANLKKLINLAPDIVIEFSGSTALTDSQVEKLEDAGISYLALPDVDSVSDLTECMNLLGQLFEDTDYDEASDWASDYISFVEDDLLKTVKAASGSSGFYTLYVDDWDSSAKCTVTSSTNGSVSVKGGTAVVKNKNYTEKQYFCDLLDYAGVSDTVDTYGVNTTTKATKYFCPLYPRTSSISISGGSLATATFPKSAKFLEQDDASLGTAMFPSVIAADEDTATGIENSRDMSAGSNGAAGQWSVYSTITDSHNGFTGTGFLDAGGFIISTQISGDYDVLVNPSGFDSWAEGTCESVLEAAWTAWKITGKLDKSDVTSYVKEFYSTFYDYDLTTSELNNILNLD